MTPSDEQADRAAAEDMEDADPGLAAERTSLAWTRTAISFGALGGAILKIAPPAGILILAMSALIWGLGRLAGRPGLLTGGHRSRLLLVITITVFLVSSVALALALLGGRHPLSIR
jgi:uncharacterized membrane protein YidH (DUF202 family)